MLDLVPFEKPPVFVPETVPRLMAFLLADVIHNPLELRVTVGKRPEPLLPGKPTHHPPTPIDEIGRAVLHITYQIRQSHGGPEANQNVRMVSWGAGRQGRQAPAVAI